MSFVSHFDAPARTRFLALMVLLTFPGAVRAETLIAVVGPRSGPYAERTLAIETGAKKAAQRLNSETYAGFTVETFDDGCDDAKASGVARALVAKGAGLVIGHPCTNAALAAAEIYGPSRTVFIATATRHPGLTEKRGGPAVFRLAGRDGNQGQAAARYMLRAFEGATIAVVHDRTRYAKTIAEQAIETLKAAKAIPITATVVGGDKEYNVLIAKIKDASAVFFAGYPLEAGFVLKALRRAGSKADLIVSDSAATDEFTQSFPDVATGVTALLPITQGSSSEPALGDDERAGYAAVEIFASAQARAAKYRRMVTELEALSIGSHASVLGPIRFDGNGNADVPDYSIAKWNGAQWAPAKNPLGATTR